MPGASTRPQPYVQIKKARKLKSPQVRRNVPAFPARLVLTVSFEVSLVIGLSCHPAQCEALSRVDTSVEISGRYDFAVRDRHIRRVCCRVHRIFRPTFSDDRETPLLTGRKTRQELPLICPSSQAGRLRQIGTTGKSLRALETGCQRFQKHVPKAQGRFFESLTEICRTAAMEF
jgi:hypothetical protein